MNVLPPSSESAKLAQLRARLAEADATLHAIGSGEVDAVIGTGKTDTRIYTLGSGGDAYRTLIESMNEGALMLTRDKIIVYANACFAQMVKRPLEQVIGSTFRDFIPMVDQRPLRGLLQRAAKSGLKVGMMLDTGDGAELPVMISLQALGIECGEIATSGMVVTDMSETRRNEELLRGFSQRLVQMQEAERERVAFELHGHITQLLCAILVHSGVLEEKLPPHDRTARREAKKLRKMVGEAATAVERISRHLRPSALDHLGLSAMIRSEGRDFSARTGVPVEFDCDPSTPRLPPDAELAFYRILQEALGNVERHSHAKHATVHLTQEHAFVEMSIQDDGIGFNPAIPGAKPGFGIHSMRERANAVGGSVNVESSPGHGTTIHAQMPFAGKQSPQTAPTP